MKSGLLYLVSTPIDDHSNLTAETVEFVKSEWERGSIIAVEEAKACRRRWLRFGLPKEAIADFVIYNEHNQKNDASQLVKELKSGKNILLFSDCGLPAFCDPGQYLVQECHRQGIRVSATACHNSPLLAFALSGFEAKEWVFRGFLPRNKEEYTKKLGQLVSESRVQLIMDTPYRLTKTLSSLSNAMPNRQALLALDLGMETERVKRGQLAKLCKEFSDIKAEFILVLGPKLL
ncbi:MAG: hypothetical protein HOE90_14420 [Bacteriovoracaceae bacterium]|nr:hypothetical protein [Bacteriovoracaceae bacterium]